MKREPNGRAERAGQGDAMRLVVLSQPHRACLPSEARRDHRAESAVGRMFLSGRITAPECEAGERLAAKKHAFDRALAAPPGVRSAAGQMVADRVSGDDVAAHEGARGEDWEDEEERADRALSQWDFAEAVVWDAVGSRDGFRMVMGVVCEGQDLDRRAEGYVAALGQVRAALGALALRWRLDMEAESATDRARRMRVAVDGVEIKREKQRKSA